MGTREDRNEKMKFKKSKVFKERNMTKEERKKFIKEVM